RSNTQFSAFKHVGDSVEKRVDLRAAIPGGESSAPAEPPPPVPLHSAAHLGEQLACLVPPGFLAACSDLGTAFALVKHLFESVKRRVVVSRRITVLLYGKRTAAHLGGGHS